MEIFKHDCKLTTNQEESVINRYIQSGLFISARRKFRLSITISINHPCTRLYFKSNSAIVREQNRHLLYYYNMIHPLSMFSFWLECFLTLGVASTSIIPPIYVYLQAWNNKVLISSTYIIELSTLALHAIMHCSIGYIKNERVILDKKMICQKYVRSYFITDLLALLLLLFGIMNRVFRWVTVIQGGLAVIYGSFITFLPAQLEAVKLYSNFMKYVGKYGTFFRLFRIIYILMVYLVLYLITYWYFIIDHEAWDLIKHNSGETHADTVAVLFIVIPLLLGANNYDLSNIPVTNERLRLSMVIILTIASLIGQFLVFLTAFRWYQNYTSVRNQKMDFERQFQEYMTYHELSPSLRNRMMSYFNFKHRDNFYDHGVVINVLPTSLLHEINRDLCDKILGKINFFALLPPKALTILAGFLDPKVFLPGDHIVEYGEVGASMYLIHIGSVAVYVKENIEVCHLNEGDYFGEFALILDIPRTASVVAITHCKILRLDRDHFNKVLKYYPDVKRQMETILQRRLNVLQSTY